MHKHGLFLIGEIMAKMMNNEHMKYVEGYEGFYSVTDDGRVFSWYSNKFLSRRPDKDGYKRVNLHKDGEMKTHQIHRLVAAAFVENPDNLPEVDHINRIRHDNRFENLRWVTHKQNMENTKKKKEDYDKQVERLVEHNSKQVRCIELDEVFGSVREAARMLGKDHSLIAKCCRGVKQSAYGYHWEYVYERICD